MDNINIIYNINSLTCEEILGDILKQSIENSNCKGQ